jgi:hypothetical protein
LNGSDEKTGVGGSAKSGVGVSIGAAARVGVVTGVGKTGGANIAEHAAKNTPTVRTSQIFLIIWWRYYIAKGKEKEMN